MKKALLLFGLLMTLTIPSGLWAQQAGYSQANPGLSTRYRRSHHHRPSL